MNNKHWTVGNTEIFGNRESAIEFAHTNRLFIDKHYDQYPAKGTVNGNTLNLETNSTVRLLAAQLETGVERERIRLHSPRSYTKAVSDSTHCETRKFG